MKQTITRSALGILLHHIQLTDMGIREILHNNGACGCLFFNESQLMRWLKWHHKITVKFKTKQPDLRTDSPNNMWQFTTSLTTKPSSASPARSQQLPWQPPFLRGEQLHTRCTNRMWACMLNLLLNTFWQRRHCVWPRCRARWPRRAEEDLKARPHTSHTLPERHRYLQLERYAQHVLILCRRAVKITFLIMGVGSGGTGDASPAVKKLGGTFLQIREWSGPNQVSSDF